MAAQKMFIASQRVFARTGFSGVKRDEPINETELHAMGQMCQCLCEQVSHLPFIK
jgi:hypothetical protein